jgi:hypothetical protein
MLKIFIIIINIYYSFCLLNKSNNKIININPFVLGKFELRSTNDPSLKDKYTYLILNNDDTIKLKTITKNGIVGTKISRTGKIIIKNNYNFFNYNKFDNNINIKLNYNNVNKYSYSIFDIEIPEFRYEQISNYNIEKELSIIEKNKSIFVIDNKLNYYYLFDTDNSKTKLPYIDITLVTLLSTQTLTFVINIILMHFFNIKF